MKARYVFMWLWNNLHDVQMFVFWAALSCGREAEGESANVLHV